LKASKQLQYRSAFFPAAYGRTALYSEEEMLRRLRRLLNRRGYLSKKLVDESKGIVTASSFEKRFGSLSRAYRLIGYVHKKTTALASASVQDASTSSYFSQYFKRFD
jgi:hypothetical protein